MCRASCHAKICILPKPVTLLGDALMACLHPNATKCLICVGGAVLHTDVFVSELLIIYCCKVLTAWRAIY